jgi:hypothetical protein
MQGSQHLREILSLRTLLWVDCCAGFSVGAVGLALTAIGPLSQVLGLPKLLLFVIGFANLLYASYSFSIAIAALPSVRPVLLLVSANLAWAVACLVMVASYLGVASMLGLGCLLFEAFFVGALAYFEWRAVGLYIAATKVCVQASRGESLRCF